MPWDIKDANNNSTAERISLVSKKSSTIGDQYRQLAQEILNKEAAPNGV